MSRSVGAVAMEYAAVTESVALKVARLEGSGIPETAYTLAAECFRTQLEKVSIPGRVAILRERRVDEKGRTRTVAKRGGILDAGDSIPAGTPEVDLAVEPVEGLSQLVKGQEGSIVAVAASPVGTMLRTPDMYMSKLIVGPKAKEVIDIDSPAGENVQAVADALGLKTTELIVAVLERDRHDDLIDEIRETGARIHIRSEGDLIPAISVGLRGSELHAVVGIGGAPEGVLAAAAVKCLGGGMQARMWPTQRSQVERLREYGMDDPEKKLTLDDLVSGDDVVFAATGLTSGDPLRGVSYFRGGGRTHSIVMSSRPRMIRYVDTIHSLEPDAGKQGFRL